MIQRILNSYLCTLVDAVAGRIIRPAKIGKEIDCRCQNAGAGIDVTEDISTKIMLKEAKLFGVSGREMHVTWYQVIELAQSGKVDLKRVAPPINYVLKNLKKASMWPKRPSMGRGSSFLHNVSSFHLKCRAIKSGKLKGSI